MALDMENKFTVACVQNSAIDDLDHNLRDTKELVRNAVGEGADFICLPEYFPVILAACEAMCEPQFNLHGITASTMGAAPLILVNGPISKKLKINSGFGVLLELM